MDAHFKLKWLNGPLTGRELHVPPGPFTIGGEACDLVLPLDGGATARLEIASQSVDLVSDTPCWVAGLPHPPGPLPAQVAVDLAGLHFVYGPVDAELAWPEVVPRGRKRRMAWAIAAATLGLAAMSSWALYPAKPLPPPTPRDWLPQAMAGQPGLSAHWLENGILVLSGHCSNFSQLSALAEQLRAAGVRVQQETVCDDEVRQSVKALLADFGYLDVSVTLDADHRATIDGSVRNDEHFPALAEALDRLPGLSGWQLSDRRADELATLLPQLQNAGLLVGLSAVRGDRGWVLSGQFDPARQAALMRMLEHWNAEPGRRHPLRFVNAASAAQAADYLPAAIASVGGNAQAPFVELANGMRLQSGSPVAQGMRVLAISPDGISLVSDRQLAFLSLHD